VGSAVPARVGSFDFLAMHVGLCERRRCELEDIRKAEGGTAEFCAAVQSFVSSRSQLLPSSPKQPQNAHDGGTVKISVREFPNQRGRHLLEPLGWMVPDEDR